MHLLWWSSLLLLTTACSVSQPARDPDQIMVHTAVTDQLGNLYFAKYSNEIIKQDPSGKQIGYFSNNRLGQIGMIDATSPLKVLVFYPSFNTGVVLDRRLLETGQFNLIDMGFGEIDLVAFSRDGTLWIFDDHEQRIFKVNQQGQRLRTGDDLRLVFNERLQPVRMIEAGESVYLSVPGRGVLIFDLFGQYKSQMLYPEIHDFQIIEDKTLVFEKEDQLVVVHLDSGEEERYKLSSALRDGRVLLTNQNVLQITASEIRRLPPDQLLRE